MFTYMIGSYGGDFVHMPISEIPNHAQVKADGVVGHPNPREGRVDRSAEK